MRSTNLPLVLRQLRDHGPRSRARLATDLGLTRSAASALVSELEGLGLVRSAGPERGGLGRPGIAVELDGRHVCGIGAEVNVNHVSTMALDLSGGVVAEHRLSLDVRRIPVGEVLDRLVDLLHRTDADVRAAGATTVGVSVGVAGLLDREREVLTLGPNLDWRDVPVGAELRDRLDGAFALRVENEGNLAAIAEALPGDASRQDIVVIFGELGVGGGIVAGGRLLRGHQGYSGEFGHMIVQPGGRRCGCGRVGCWETVSGLRALLDAAADSDDQVRDPALSLDDRLLEINRRAELGDGRTLAALREVGMWIGVGAAMLTNALNPAAIVLSGYFASLGPHLQPTIQEQLLAGVLAPQAGGTRVEFSTLGFTAAVRGGATVALEAVFDDPTIVAPPGADHLAGGA
ncbi:MAG: ROK family transcriptional regulator [Nocardioides sp.]